MLSLFLPSAPLLCKTCISSGLLARKQKKVNEMQRVRKRERKQCICANCSPDSFFFLSTDPPREPLEHSIFISDIYLVLQFTFIRLWKGSTFSMCLRVPLFCFVLASMITFFLFSFSLDLHFKQSHVHIEYLLRLRGREILLLCVLFLLFPFVTFPLRVN